MTDEEYANCMKTLYNALEQDVYKRQQQTGANITSALTSKAASVRKEKESKTTTTKETYTSERWGKEGGTTIHQISFTVDISKIKDLPLLYKLIDELKDAQNRTDSPTRCV